MRVSLFFIFFKLLTPFAWGSELEQRSLLESSEKPGSSTVDARLSSKRYNIKSTQMKEVKVEVEKKFLPTDRIFLNSKRSPAQIRDKEFSEEKKIDPSKESPPDLLKDHLKSLWDADSGKKVDHYKQELHPEDNRINQMEIFINSGVITNSSQSNYSYRSYDLVSGFYQVGARLWLTPRLGISGKYLSSLGAQISAAGFSGAKVPVVQEDAQFDFEIRDYFGMTRKSKSLHFGISYFENKLSPSNSETTRIKLKTSGIALFLKGRIPHVPGYASHFSTFLAPKTQHQEFATQLDLSSGGAPDSMRYGAGLGGELKFNRKNQVLWNLQYSLEKIQFGGSTTVADPNTGGYIQNVSVSNQSLQFSLGYQFGN